MRRLSFFSGVAWRREWIWWAPACAALVAAGYQLIAAGWHVVGGAPISSPQPGVVAPPATPAGKPSHAVVGCAAARCHGGAIPEAVAQPDEEPWRFAATVWSTRDPHARAWSVLKEEKSRAIIERLGWEIPAHENQACLACHSNPWLAHEEPAHDFEAARSGGVGCESCHGKSDGWLVAHRTWTPATDRDQEYPAAGMAKLYDLDARAAVCAGCHVGAGKDVAGVKVARDVNHDLIAAGHPRLSFEFLTSLRRMPRHWLESDRAAPGPRAPRTRLAFPAWRAGQKAVLGASLDLLAARANVSPWPDLSEYQCFACHHDLAGRGGSTKPGQRPGSLVWHRDDDLARLAPPPAPFAEFRAKIAAQTLDKRAGELAQHLKGCLEAISANPQGQLKAARKAVAAAGTLSWNEAVEIYRSLAAIELDRRERGDAAKPLVERQFREVFHQLRLDRHELPESPRYDSPKWYEPEAARSALGDLIGALGG